MRIFLVKLPIQAQNSTIIRSSEKSICFSIVLISLVELGMIDPTEPGDLMNCFKNFFIVFFKLIHCMQNYKYAIFIDFFIFLIQYCSSNNYKNYGLRKLL